MISNSLQTRSQKMMLQVNRLIIFACIILLFQVLVLVLLLSGSISGFASGFSNDLHTSSHFAHGEGYPESGPNINPRLVNDIPGDRDRTHLESPALVLVMDDFGYAFESEPVKGILNLDVPVTVAVIPGHWASRRVATEAQRLGKEVIIHLPMEATRVTGSEEKQMIKAGMTATEIAEFLKYCADDIYNAIGFNNHMGSGATQNSSLMAELCTQAVSRGWIILDSLTHPSSVLYEEALKAGAHSAQRDVFLDHSNDPIEIKKALRKAVALSKKVGRPIIVIGHPRKVTWQVLKNEIPLLIEEGVHWYSLSDVVETDLTATL